ncbi:cytochrome P450 [Halomarina litorea]|uniref:cytochrome P450 n=1 Tax=Halomarina litorea TaxID=2961595 RepID=UPI0020C50992|nr:cytochrome P450 [Halomarina sp. BCD28]
MSSAGPLQTFPDALSSRDAWLDPFDWYAEMRATSPVRRDPDRGCWDVFSYADVKAVLGDDETFSTDPRNATGFQARGEEAFMLETMLFQDPPKHDRTRDVVDEFFRPSAVKSLEPFVEAETNRLLDEAMADADGGEVDLVEALAYPIPVIVIAKMLGVPAEDRAQFKQWSDTIVEGTAGDGEGDAEALQQRQMEAGMELANYFRDLIADRRDDPREDLVTRIVQADADMTETELLGFCMLLLVAGNVTTTNLVANTVRCFADADHWPRSGLETTVEEALRYRSPVQAMTRVAREDVTLAGQRVEEGDTLVCWLGSANRDGAQFADADAFVPDRRPNQHLGFGYGTHYCLGAPLARLEATVALRELLGRFEVTPAWDELRPVRSSFIYGVESLPVRLTER